MKKTAIAAGQVCLFAKLSVVSRLRHCIAASLLTSAVFFTAPALAGDSCETALCMWGMVTGTDDSSCDGAIQDYFNILVFKKHKINWDATAQARLDFTNSCEGSDPDHNQETNDMFGKSRG